LSTTEELLTETPSTGAELTEAPAHDHESDGHDHAAHDHAGHTHAPALNPECRREVSIEIPAEQVDKQFAVTLKGYRKQARIPGFRAGKVPESLIRKRFAEQLQRDVVEALLPSVFRAEIEKQGLAPVSQPQITDMQFHEGQPLTFKAEFEVMPEFSIDGYQSVTVDKPDTTLTDEDMDRALTELRESRYTMEPLPENHALVDGDFAQITFEGFFDGSEPVEAGTERKADLNGRNAMIELGGKDTVEAFTEALRGTTPGQQLTLEVSYPADFAEKKLAGKNVKYEISVNAAKQRVVPELNDDLAKELGDYEDLEAFKASFREHIAGRKKRQLEGDAREKLIRAMTEKFTFPVPESMVQQQIDARLERGLRALAQQGMSPDDMRKLDFDRLREGQREGATHEVRAALVMDKIADAERVEVEDSELDRELEVASMETREPVEAIRKRLTEDGSLAKIREQIRREKAATLLYNRFN
jgi:trigger factor